MVRPHLACAVLGLLLLPTSASAHKIHLFASVDGTTIQGKAYFTIESPARGLSVVAADLAGEQLGRTTTDEQGEFRIEARFRCDHRLTVSTVDGHGASYTVAVAELPQQLPPREPHTESSHAPSDGSELEALRTQIVELRQQFDEHGQRTRMQDVLGAVGYILGIAGVAFYFLALRKRPTNTAVPDEPGY